MNIIKKEELALAFSSFFINDIFGCYILTKR